MKQTVNSLTYSRPTPAGSIGQSLNMTLNGAIYVVVVVYVYDLTMYDDFNFQAHEKADIDIVRVFCIIVVSQINTVIYRYLQTSTSASVPRANTARLVWTQLTRSPVCVRQTTVAPPVPVRLGDDVVM